MVSGTLSPRSSRCFLSFSRLTGSLSVVETYLALEGGPPMFSPGFTSPNLLYGSPASRYRTFTFSGASFKRFAVPPVYPLSLAATHGVAVAFLSSGYLDVSVRLVRSIGPMHSARSDLTVGLPHSEIRGSRVGYHLPPAYRRFQRPSSPLNAKTSTMCPY